MSTVQQPRLQREESSRSRGDTKIDRYGSFTNGVKKYATSALTSTVKEQLIEGDDLSEDIDSDESDIDIKEPTPKKARANDEALLLTGYPLLPEDIMGADMDVYHVRRE